MKNHASLYAAGLIAFIMALSAHADPQPTSSGAVRTVVHQSVQTYTLQDLKDEQIGEDQMKIEIGYIESHIQMPTGAKPIEQYARFYAQDKDKGFIHGAYLPVGEDPAWTAGIHIVDYDKLPIVMDGGCHFIDLVFIRKIHALRAACHGVA